MLVTHLVEKLPYLLFIAVIAINRYSLAASGRDRLSRGLNRTGQAGFSLTARAASDIDSSAAGTQRHSDALPGATAGAGDDHYPLFGKPHKQFLYLIPRVY